MMPADRGVKKPMMSTVDTLVLDLLEWVASRERTYADAMDAWRTSCPRLPVWEEATERGLIVREQAEGRATVRITSEGLDLLERYRPSPGAVKSDAGSVDNPRSTTTRKI
jgi:D-3-phosphoglycerate dehydrogenase